jgi:hypothetical protein
MKEHTFTIQFLAPGRTLDDLSIDLYDRIDDASLMGPAEDEPNEDRSFLYEFDRQALNDALDIRWLSAKLDEPQRRAVASALPANLAA